MQTELFAHAACAECGEDYKRDERGFRIVYSLTVTGMERRDFDSELCRARYKHRLEAHLGIRRSFNGA